MLLRSPNSRPMSAKVVVEKPPREKHSAAVSRMAATRGLFQLTACGNTPLGTGSESVRECSRASFEAVAVDIMTIQLVQEWVTGVNPQLRTMWSFWPEARGSGEISRFRRKNFYHSATETIE